MQPDELLWRRLRRGDARALEQLYEAEVDGLYGFVLYRVGGDRAIAEDVVADTFLKAIDAIDDFDPARGSFGAWLRTLSRNVVRSHLRARRRAVDLHAMWERVDRELARVFASLDRAPLSDEVIAREETKHIVNMTIANLPDHYRDALHRKYVGGETLAEMAARLDMSEQAAKSLLARARRAFREAFTTMTQMAEVK